MATSQRLSSDGRAARFRPWLDRVVRALAVDDDRKRVAYLHNGLIFPAIHLPIAVTLRANKDLTFRLQGDAGFGSALPRYLGFIRLLAVIGLACLRCGVATGRSRRMPWPIRPRELFSTVLNALRFKLHHGDMHVGAIGALAVIVTAAWPFGEPVRSSLLTPLGGLQDERLLHDLARGAQA